MVSLLAMMVDIIAKGKTAIYYLRLIEVSKKKRFHLIDRMKCPPNFKLIGDTTKDVKYLLQNGCKSLHRALYIKQSRLQEL